MNDLKLAFRQLLKNPGFTAVAVLTLALEETKLTLGGAEATKLNAVFATGNYFSMLGATTELGRTWGASECATPGACPFAVLSYDFWQRQYGGDRGVMGRTISLNRQPITILGVAARDFRGVDITVPDMWVPLLMREQLVPEPGQLTARDFSWLRVIGRLKPGVSVAQARQAFNLIAAQS